MRNFSEAAQFPSGRSILAIYVPGPPAYDENGQRPPRPYFPFEHIAGLAEVFCQFRCWPEADDPPNHYQLGTTPIGEIAVNSDGSAEGAAGLAQWGDTFGLPLSGAFGFELVEVNKCETRTLSRR